jgi:MFS family permease
VTWGFIIFDTDGIGARLYPFVWRPRQIITVDQYAVIQALQVGLGILLGAYLMSRVADRYGRRVAILLAPNLWIIAVFFVLSRIGVVLWLFNLYNYTAVAYPTRILATAFAWTDGLGHLGAWDGVILLGPL